MYKIAVVGDYDSIYGFATLGLSICPVRNREEIREKLRSLAEEEYGIIYITETAAAEVGDELEKIVRRLCRRSSRYREYPAIPEQASRV